MLTADYIVSLIESVKREINYRPLVLGGWSGPYGGTGGPPGGFIGYLPQVRVAYDETESEDCNIPSGATPSLLHNLNKIRCRIRNIEDYINSSSGSANVSIANVVPENASTKDYYGIVYWSGTQDPYKFRAIKQVFGPLEIKTDWNDGIYDHTGFITIGSRAVEFIRDPYPNLPSGESLILREISYGGLYGKEYQLKKLISTDNSILISGTADGYLDLKVSGGMGGSIVVENEGFVIRNDAVGLNFTDLVFSVEDDPVTKIPYVKGEMIVMDDFYDYSTFSVLFLSYNINRVLGVFMNGVLLRRSAYSYTVGTNRITLNFSTAPSIADFSVLYTTWGDFPN